MNNSVFGKTQEHLRNRIGVEAITSESVARKCVCKPSFKCSQAIHEILVIMQTAIANPFTSDLACCFTDIDSLLYEVERYDICGDMPRLLHSVCYRRFGLPLNAHALIM